MEADLIFDRFMPYALVGKKLTSFGRACNLISLCFSGEEELRINIQGGMRVLFNEKVIVSSNDMYSGADGGDFDWTEDETIFDRRMNSFMRDYAAEAIVASVAPEKCGDMKIAFANGVALQILVDTSEEKEIWRMFYSDRTGPLMHLVQTTSSLAMEE